MTYSAALTAACLAVFADLSALHIPVYALIAIAGIVAALWLSLRTAPLRALSPDRLWDAGFFAIIAAFVISRALGFLLLFVIERGQLTISFRDVLRFSSLSYLSLFVTAVAVAAWLRWKGLSILRMIDAWAPCGALLWSAISVAEAATGTENGLPTRLPWGVRTAAGIRVHPVALYTAAAALFLCGALFSLLRRVRTPGRVASIAIVAAGVIVFLFDMLRAPEQPFGRGLLDVSQWLALASILFGVCLFTFARASEVR
ncbi:MAG TPA: prolipoprotein diacylglyceryl transferase family protein [Acidobacteriaceae bacterium]|nr:prolipoprotein diacylglyceryl transferase family protein [Acidobacteriaceae bacterium]